MKNKCQNITETRPDELLKLLQTFEYMFEGTLGTWKTYPVGFKIEEDAKPI